MASALESWSFASCQSLPPRASWPFWMRAWPSAQRRHPRLGQAPQPVLASPGGPFLVSRLVHQQGGADRDEGHHQECRRPGLGPGAVMTGPPGEPPTPPLRVGRDRFIGEPMLDVLGQVARRGIPVLGPEGHRLQADRLQAGATPFVIRRGGGKSPRCTFCKTTWVSRSSNAARPVRRQ